MASDSASRLHAAMVGAYFAVAIFFTLYLVNYYLTGEGGPTVLAVMLVPVAFVLFVLEELRRDDFYPRFGFVPGRSLGVICAGAA